MFGFLEKNSRTPAQQKAAGALADLDDDLVSRTYAERAAPLAEERATTRFGPRTKRSKWWGWVLGKRGDDYTGLPGDDHVEHREKDGRRVHLSQPYQIMWEDLRALVRHCETHGLRAEITADSWYFPGFTVVVVVEKDEPR